MGEITCRVDAPGWRGDDTGQGDEHRQAPAGIWGPRNGATVSYPFDVIVTPDGFSPFTHTTGKALLVWQGDQGTTEGSPAYTVDLTKGDRYLTFYVPTASRFYLCKQQDWPTITAVTTACKVFYLQDGTGFVRRAQPKGAASAPLGAILLTDTLHGFNRRTYGTSALPSLATYGAAPYPSPALRNTPPASFFSPLLSSNRLALSAKGVALAIGADGRLVCLATPLGSPGTPVALPSFGNGIGLISETTTFLPHFDANSTLDGVAVSAGIAQFADGFQVAFAAQVGPLPGGVAGQFTVTVDRSGLFHTQSGTAPPDDGTACIALVTVKNRPTNDWVANGNATIRGRFYGGVPGNNAPNPSAFHGLLADNANNAISPGTFANPVVLPATYPLAFDWPVNKSFPPGVVGYFLQDHLGAVQWNHNDTQGFLGIGTTFEPCIIVPSGSTLANSPAWDNPLTYVRLSFNSADDTVVLGIVGTAPFFPDPNTGQMVDYFTSFPGVDPCNAVFGRVARPADNAHFTNVTLGRGVGGVYGNGNWGAVYDTGPIIAVVPVVADTTYVLGVCRDADNACWWALVEQCNTRLGTALTIAFPDSGFNLGLGLSSGTYSLVIGNTAGPATAVFFDGSALGQAVPFGGKYPHTQSIFIKNSLTNVGDASGNAVVSVDTQGGVHTTPGLAAPTDGSIAVAVLRGLTSSPTVAGLLGYSVPITSGYPPDRSVAILRSSADSPTSAGDWDVVRLLTSSDPLAHGILDTDFVSSPSTVAAPFYLFVGPYATTSYPSGAHPPLAAFRVLYDDRYDLPTAHTPNWSMRGLRVAGAGSFRVRFSDGFIVAVSTPTELLFTPSDGLTFTVGVDRDGSVHYNGGEETIATVTVNQGLGAWAHYRAYACDSSGVDIGPPANFASPATLVNPYSVGGGTGFWLNDGNDFLLGFRTDDFGSFASDGSYADLFTYHQLRIIATVRTDGTGAIASATRLVTVGPEGLVSFTDGAGAHTVGAQQSRSGGVVFAAGFTPIKNATYSITAYWDGGPIVSAVFTQAEITVTGDLFLGIGAGGAILRRIALDAPSAIWVTNSVGSTISQFTPAGSSAGSPLGGGGGLSTPFGIQNVGTEVWVANESSGGVVTRFDRTGTFLGSVGASGQNRPIDLAVVGSQVWIANHGASSVVRVNFDGTAAGAALTGNGLSTPRGIGVIGTQVWVTNQNDTISRFNPDGTSAGSVLSLGGIPNGVLAVGGQAWVALITPSAAIRRLNFDGTSAGADIALASADTPNRMALVENVVWVACNNSIIVLLNQDGTTAGADLAGNGLNAPGGIVAIPSQGWPATRWKDDNGLGLWTYETADGTVVAIPDTATMDFAAGMFSLKTQAYTRARFGSGGSPGVVQLRNSQSAFIDQAGVLDYGPPGAFTLNAVCEDGAGGLFAISDEDLWQRPGPAGTTWVQITSGYGNFNNPIALERHPYQAHTVAYASIPLTFGESAAPVALVVDLIDTLSGAVTPGAQFLFPNLFAVPPAVNSIAWGFGGLDPYLIGTSTDNFSDVAAFAVPRP